MGSKGDKATEEAAAFCEAVVSRLEAIPLLTTRKQFGGHGIFQDGKMFGIVSSDAVLFFKVNETTLPAYRKAKAPQHGKMPYYRVPKPVFADDASLLQWAQESVEASKS